MRNPLKTNNMSVFYDGYRERNPVKWAKRWCKHWKWAYQRAVRGYADCDAWDLRVWFLGVMPDMLEQFAEHTQSFPLTGDPDDEQLSQNSHAVHCITLSDDTPDEIEYREQRYIQWQNTIKAIAEKLREADEDTCSKKNPMAEEFHKMYEEFNTKYGLFGEKLETEEEKAKHIGGRVMHFPSEAKAEWAEITEKYRKEAINLDKYRHICFEEAMGQFIKWFWDMWD